MTSVMHFGVTLMCLLGLWKFFFFVTKSIKSWCCIGFSNHSNHTVRQSLMLIWYLFYTIRHRLFFCDPKDMPILISSSQRRMLAKLVFFRFIVDSVVHQYAEEEGMRIEPQWLPPGWALNHKGGAVLVADVHRIPVVGGPSNSNHGTKTHTVAETGFVDARSKIDKTDETWGNDLM